MNSFRNEQAKIEKNAVDNIKNNPKYFYTYANSKSRVKTNIGPLRKDDTIYDNKYDMANILSDQYKQTFSTPKFTPQEISESIDEEKLGIETI